MDRLTALSYFIRAADAGSFTRAAALLGVSLSTVSRAIDFLEQELGTPLFVRTTRKVTLTTAGEAMRPQAENILKLSETLYSNVRASAGLAPEGTLRVSSSIVIGRVFLQYIILKFRRRYPGVHVELFTADANVDLARTGIDIAFKVGNNLPEAAVARHLGSVHSILAASPEYLRRRPMPQEPSELARHDCVINSYFGSKTRLWNSADDSAVMDISGGFECNNTLICLDMCLAGQGIAMLPRDFISHFLQTGALVHVLPGWEGEPYGFYALTASRYLSNIGRLFLDMVREELLPVSGSVYAVYAADLLKGKNISRLTGGPAPGDLQPQVREAP